ncbi:HAD family hydrolase [Alphaproteobacteria bacterium]|jgi:phosphoglycolate phosphatase|nr:HAD family hydrolase [Alphaproteobacteria bacterium]
MIKLLVFDKDGVILDLVATWLPVIRAVAEYTVSRLPDGYDGGITRTDLLAVVGVDDAADIIDPSGLFAAASFAEIREAWQEILPPDMIRLNEEPRYRDRVKELVLELARGSTITKGDVKTPLTALHEAGFKLAVLTNDNADSAAQNLRDLDIDHLFHPILGADSGYGGKPAPDGLLHCCALHNVDPSEAIMIGDTSADYGVAVNGKVADFICIADDPAHRPDEAIPVSNVIARLTDLPRLLGTRNDTVMQQV